MTYLDRAQIDLSPLNANATPTVRWVRVQPDGGETDYAAPPMDLPTIKVTLGKGRKATAAFWRKQPPPTTGHRTQQ